MHQLGYGRWPGSGFSPIPLTTPYCSWCCGSPDQGWSGIKTALVVLVLRVPALFFGRLVGRAVDLWGARLVARLDLTVRGVSLLFLLGAGLITGGLPLPVVLVAGRLSAAVSPATYAAIRWSVPRMVRREQLGRANTVVGLGEQLPLLAGGALVGPALAWLGPVVSVAVPAVMLLVAAALAGRLPTAAPTAVADKATSVDPTRDARPRPRLPRRVTALILLSTAYYLAYGPFETAMPAFVRDRLHASPSVYSLVWAAFGLGAVAGLAAAPMLARRRPGLVNALGATVWGLVMLPVAVVGTVPGATVLFLLGGVVWGPYTTVEAGAMQRWTPPSRHGAVFGLQRALLGTAAPTGAAVGAVAIQYTAPQLILAISAALCATAGLLALAHPSLRRTR
ncbi:MFS transporter [Actinoplanes sp. NPDC051343]|uniref:MFS transporter n=1 Tax=Actinoplanes sp. NPDC051343 TaxID=3363906 RepID=UPI0037B22441